MTVEYLDAKRVQGELVPSPNCATFAGGYAGTMGSLMSGTGDWSASIWLYHTGGTSGNDGLFSSNGTAELMYFQGYTQKLFAGSGGTAISSSSTLAEDTWYHAVYTRSSGSGTLYINGSSVATGSDTTDMPSSTEWRVGHAHSSEVWAGSAIEFAVWNGRALTLAEVQSIYNSGDGKKIPNATLNVSGTSYTEDLTGYYPMDTDFDKFAGTGGTNGVISGSATVDNSSPATPIPAQDDKATLVTPAEADGYAIGDGGDFAYGSGTAHYKFLHGASGSTASTAFWIYRDGNQATEAMVCTTSDNSNASGHQGASVYFMTDNNIHYLISAGDDSNAPFTSTGVTIADQTWTHIACTLSESGGTYTMRIYKNGVNTDTTGTDTETFTFTPNTSNSWTSLNAFRNAGGGGNKVDGRVADMGFWEDHVLSQADITKLASGTRITDDGTGFDYSSSDIVDHYPFFTDTNDTKGSYNLTNSGLTFGSTSAPTATSASSNLPENTIFNETDTYKQYWLQDGVWQPSTPSALNMTFADQAAADLVWNPDSSDIIRIDVSNKYLFDSFDSTTSTFTMTENTYDLGSNLGTTWTVQFTLRASNFREPTSSNYAWFFGMYSADSDSTINTTQDRINIVYDMANGGGNKWRTTGANASGDGSLTTVTGTNPQLSSSTNSTDYFVTLQKTGTAGYKVVLRTGSHSGTVVGLQEKVWEAGTPSTFRYFGMKTRMANSSRMGAIIKDVIVYDGALVG